MEIYLDPARLAEFRTVAEMDSFACPGPQHSQPTALVDGASFPAIPTMGGFLAVTSMTAVGTTSCQCLPPAMKNLDLALPAKPGAAASARRYARLREEIVAAGIPLLDDEELRAEIRDRKGVRTGLED